jgi:uncharacterized protein (TIGR02444 family)
MAGTDPLPPAGPEGLSLDNALWRFALDFYGREGVPGACLALQDRIGVDVDILLLAIFAQRAGGRALDREELGAADSLVRDWRTGVVHVLRRLRVGLKTGPAPGPSPATERLRNEIKAAELRSEQIELALLFDWLERRPGGRAADAADGKTAPASVAGYFATDAAALAAPEVEAALQTLRRAIRQAADQPGTPS